MPPLQNYPKAHQVTYKYYLGVIYFLEEDYARAEEELELAYAMCTTSESKNRQLILTYLIPTKMITKHQLPSRGLLEAHPALATLFSPICSAVRTGNLKALDDALANGEAEFVKRRVYLTLERSRDVTIRNLFRKVFLVGGYIPLKEGETTLVRRTRIPIPEFATALAVSGAEVSDGEGGIDRDEVECAIANMIYKVRPCPTMILYDTTLTWVLGFDERLHRARPQHGRPEQSRRFPRHWGLSFGNLVRSTARVAVLA